MDRNGQVGGSYRRTHSLKLFYEYILCPKIHVEISASLILIRNIDIVNEYKYVFITAIKYMFLIMHGILNK